MKDHQLLGLRITGVKKFEVARSIIEWVHSGGRCRWLACLNPHSFIVAQRDPDALSALVAADWLVPDGIGILIAARMLKTKVPARVTGSDVYSCVMAMLNDAGAGRVFFLGSSEQVLKEIEAQMRVDFPNVESAGSFSPPFRKSFSAEEEADMVRSVNQSNADILWVGMTAPKQDIWLHRNAHRLNVRFAAGIGAVFDFYSGNIKRPSVFFQRMGLEWLPRLILDWRRLWRRTFVSGPQFLWYVLTRRLRSS